MASPFLGHYWPFLGDDHGYMHNEGRAPFFTANPLQPVQERLFQQFQKDGRIPTKGLAYDPLNIFSLHEPSNLFAMFAALPKAAYPASFGKRTT